MKLISCTIWVLAALLVIVTLDTIPDPPAVSPDNATVKAPCPQESPGSVLEQRLAIAAPSASSHGNFRFVAFQSNEKPSRPSDRAVLTGQAADPSPPLT